jgi:hypothetical protein
MGRPGGSRNFNKAKKWQIEIGHQFKLHPI